jgi:hypothetical protein
MIGFTSNNPQLPMSNHTMKKLCILPLIAALAFFVSCQKQQTEEEKRAEVERQVQERLAAERQTDEKQRLAQQQADLEAREKAVADKEAANAPVTPSLTPAERVRREQADTRTERRSETTATYGTFYQKLEPYGAWRETADYGYVWQPRDAEQSQSWRPYTDGRWAYSDAGWTWISDEPFGWATYHYGRWLRLRRVGWVWVPGDEWAPAWVSWRTSKNYVGWAPLPPEARFDRRHGIHNWADSYYDIGPDQYAFVPGNEFGSQHVRRSVVPAERNVTIVNETTNVTNITYSNTTIINQGPDYEEMRSRSQQPMERYRLRRHAEIDNESVVATVRGDEIVITVPLLNNVPGFHRPRAIKERVSEVVIDNGWTEIADRSAAERARAKMKAEATPPPDAPPKTFVKPQETTPTPTPATTAAATTAASPSPTAAATSTVPATASATPTAQAAATTPSAASPSASVRTSPSPSASTEPSATATPPHTPAPAESTAPSATPSPKVSASPSVRTRPSPSASIEPTATAAPSHTPTRAVSTAPAATPSPVASASPSIRVRPSPPITLRPSPSIAPSVSASATVPETKSQTQSNAEKAAEMQRKLEAAQKNRRLPDQPASSATITPTSSPVISASTPPVKPPRRIPPLPVDTPAAAGTPPATTESATTPPPRFTPVRKATVPSAVTQPVATPPATDTVVPTPTIQRRLVPRPTPPVSESSPAASAPASSPTIGDEKANNKKPKRPGAGDSETPTPSPSTAPN